MRQWRRQCRAQPWAYGLVVVTFTLSITTAVLTLEVLDVLLFRPLGIPNASTVVSIAAPGQPSGLARQHPDGMSWQHFEELRASSLQSLDGLAAFGLLSAAPSRQFIAQPGGRAVHEARVAFVTGEYFAVLGVRAQRGRVLDARDEVPFQPSWPAVASHRYWTEHLSGSDERIGEPLLANEQPIRVVGVAPPAFTGIRVRDGVPDLYVPMVAAPDILGGGPFQVSTEGLPVITGDGLPRMSGPLRTVSPVSPIFSVAVVGRLARGVTPARLQVELEAVSRRSESFRGRVAPVTRLAYAAQPPGQSVPFVVFLGVAVGLTFAVGCASVAGLLVGQLWIRRHALSIQAALGAPQAHVLWYVGTGIGLLSLVGGGAALVLAHWIQGGLSTTVLPGAIELVGLERWGLSGRAAVTAAVVAVAAGLMGGSLLLARLTGPAGVASVVRGRGAKVLQGARALLCSQVWVCSGLVYLTLLLAGSVSAMLERDLGFEVHGLSSVLVTIPRLQALTEATAAVDTVETVVDRLTAVPGVEAAVGPLPLLDGPDRVRAILIDGVPSDVPVNIAYVSPLYFRVLGQEVLRGSGLVAALEPQTAVINAAAARMFWPDGDAVGRLFSFMRAQFESPPYRVVGVVENTPLSSLDSLQEPTVYMPRENREPLATNRGGSSVTQRETAMQLWTAGRTMILVRSTVPEAMLTGLVGTVTRDEGVTAGRQVRAADHVAAVMQPHTLARTVFGGLSTIVLVLAVVGICMVLAFVATAARRELSIRAMLGATRGDLARLLAKSVVVPIVFGVVAGLASAVGMGEVLGRVLYGIDSLDAVTIVSTLGILLTVSGLAAMGALSRVVQDEPMECLRHD